MTTSTAADTPRFRLVGTGAGMLTRARPSYLMQQREATRSWMLFLSLLVVLVTLWLPHPAAPSPGSVLPLIAVMIGTWVASLVPAWHPLFNRLGGMVILVQLHLLVASTGAEDSVYTRLYLPLLVYAAMFYDRNRLLFTFAVVTLAASLPRLHAGDVSAASASEQITQLGTWAIVVVTVASLTERLRSSATSDGLTGLANQTTFWRALEDEHERFERHDRPYSVILADIDHFKQTNDVHGHRTGDRVLAEVAKVLRSRVRAGDVVARYGGEEFAVLLPETGEQEALTLAEDLRRRIQDADLRPPTTASFGVASTDRTIPATADHMVQAADSALYSAKRAGRNQVRASMLDPGLPTQGSSGEVGLK